MNEPIVDAHLHLWQVSRHDWYPDLREMADQLNQPALYQDFLPEDYHAATTTLPADRFVHVSATTKPRAYLDETTWLDELATQHDLNLVSIGTVDPTLERPELMNDLERQASSPRWRGARVLTGLRPEDAATHLILGWLQQHGMLFELATQPEQMSDWIRILAGYPELRVVLEHTGWPAGTDSASHTAWLAAITSCAQATNALCKISGLGMTTFDLDEQALRPWIEPAIETFGWDRVAFGSNLPIEHIAGSYQQLQHSLGRILAEANDHEKYRFYTGNAQQTYRF